MKKFTLGDVCQKASSNIAQKDLLERTGKYPVFGASGFIKNIDFYHQKEEYIAIVKDGSGIGRTMLLPAYSSVIGTMQYLIPTKKYDIDIRYLYYAILYMNLSKYYSGSAIPHIYFRDYKIEPINIPCINKQKKISKKLNSIDVLIELRKKQLLKLDILVKSRFIEMFGDPITNNLGWEQAELCEATNKIGSGATPRGGKVSYSKEGIALIRSMNVHNGRFEYKDLAHITDEQARRLDNVIVEEDDVFINITGASVSRSCIVPKDVLPARVNQHVAIIRCISNKLHPIFANIMFLHDRFKKYLLDIGENGGATRQAITKQQLEALTVILPPIDLQNQFASFVQQVDKSKLAVKQSLEKLEILKKSLMQEYFG